MLPLFAYAYDVLCCWANTSGKEVGCRFLKIRCKNVQNARFIKQVLYVFLAAEVSCFWGCSIQINTFSASFDQPVPIAPRTTLSDNRL